MSPLPIDPCTGLRAIGVINGRVIWPIAGGAPSALEVLERREAELQNEADEICARPESGNRNELASETRRLRKITDDLAITRGRILEERRKIESRSIGAAGAEQLGANGRSADGAFGRGADTVYARGSGASYFRDLIAISVPGANPESHAAMERLQTHAQVIDRAADDLPEMFRSSPERRGAHLETRVNPNRTDGQGGFFVPPLWIIDQFVELLRPGRALADRCNVQDLPPGTDSMNLPKIATGSTTAVQTADNAAVSSTDITDSSVSAGVKTIAGQNDIAMQLLEQSPVAAGFDEVVLKDLAGDYNMKLDLQVIAGSNAAGQALGILNVGGIGAITYTDATPTFPELWLPLMQSLSQLANNRFGPADTIGMNPSLWYFLCSQLDTTGRPFIAADGDGLNSLAVYSDNATEGVVGSLAKVPIVIDANVPKNLGAGTNETRIISGRYKDAWLWEGAMRTRVMPQVLSGTLTARVQLYNYFAFMPHRYPPSWSVISGTGAIVPAGF